MKNFKLLAVAFFLAAIAPLPAYSEIETGKQLSCQTGPVTRTYGAASWLVYSCDDDRSLVIVTAPDNPAKPFYFTFFPDNGHYRLHGEGTGSKEASSAAFKEIQSLSQQDISGLIAATKAVAPVPAK